GGRASGRCRSEGGRAKRRAVRAFQTEPLAEPLEIVGPLTVTLWAASDGPDTDFPAKLIDVYPANARFPEGVALNIADGIIRALYRQSRTSAVMLEPGRPYEFTIELYPT